MKGVNTIDFESLVCGQLGARIAGVKVACSARESLNFRGCWADGREDF